MSVRAIDVSRHQNRIDWHAVKASGVQAAWIKVGGADGGLYKDSRADENLAGAEAAGVPFGTYYFFVPEVGAARRQARHAVECGYGRGKLWPSPDIEINPHGLSHRQLDQFAADVCDETMRLVHRESLIYTNAYVGLGNTDAAPAHCPLWIANYGSNRPGTTPPSFSPRLPARWSEWAVWQFNSRTNVPGIVGNTVDQNVVTDAFWRRMHPLAPVAVLGGEQEEDMYHIITDAREESGWPTWIVSGLRKAWCSSAAYAELYKDAALRDPAHFTDHGWQGGGSEWIALVDMAELVGTGPS